MFVGVFQSGEVSYEFYECQRLELGDGPQFRQVERGHALEGGPEPEKDGQYHHLPYQLDFKFSGGVAASNHVHRGRRGKRSMVLDGLSRLKCHLGRQTFNSWIRISSISDLTPAARG